MATESVLSEKSSAGRLSATTVDTDAEVCIVESLNFLDEPLPREGEIIARTLQLSGKRPHYTYVRSRLELERFIEEFNRSSFRYLHFSCHGNEKEFHTTLDAIEWQEFVKMLAPVKPPRRLFVSSCLACTPQFGHSLLRSSAWLSVVGPVGKIYFDDAAIFWTSFYHLMFKKKPTSMRNADIHRNIIACAKLIDEPFRFVFWQEGRTVSRRLNDNA